MKTKMRIITTLLARMMRLLLIYPESLRLENISNNII
jgi:hypothetical protein